MRIFNKHLDGLSILSCCTLVEDHQSPIHDSKIEKHQPRPVPAPSPEPRRSISRDKEWLTRTKSVISLMSANLSIPIIRDLDNERFSKSSHLPTSPRSVLPSPTSTIFHQIEDEKPNVSNTVFQPLYLRFSKSDNEWETVISQVCSQISPIILNDVKQPTPMADNPDSTNSIISNDKNPTKISDESGILLKLDKLSDKKTGSKAPLHMRVHSEPATFERIKMALDESYKLTQRLRDLEDDIEKKSIYLGSRPGSPLSIKGDDFPNVPELPHPLKSAPTHPFRRPGTRSLSLTSSNFRPDWGTPLPPLPLTLQLPAAKKEKTMSRISSWLISSNQTKNLEISSPITNMPGSVTDQEAFYQCLGPSQLTAGTTVSVSDCNSDQPTVWSSNNSSPVVKSDTSAFGLAEDHDLQRKSLEETVKSSRTNKNIPINIPSSHKICTGTAY
ncbi:hypothetical protein EV44_g1168 [Erysiphe necator]|uniref:Uncharacterized protein n=1 Tax=Uncinula necator TaxID=52586 RepID=A0A0B1PD38_UNCNE|nr:hypothetical protein EV44_g1168 [Erysiphe necator]